MTQGTKQRALHVLQGIRPFDAGNVTRDAVAGITLAALPIREVMGYTSIAGMPVVTGLYTILLPTTEYAILGSSRHLVVGADSATAAILAAGVGGLAAVQASECVAIAGMTALMAAGYLILARMAKLGFIADFLSRTVLITHPPPVSGSRSPVGRFPTCSASPKKAQAHECEWIRHEPSQLRRRLGT